MSFNEAVYALRFRVVGALQKEQDAYLATFSEFSLVEPPTFKDGAWTAVFDAQYGDDPDEGIADVMACAIPLAEHLWKQGVQVEWDFDNSELIVDGVSEKAFVIATLED